jgi:hypothetical protein
MFIVLKFIEMNTLMLYIKGKNKKIKYRKILNEYKKYRHRFIQYIIGSAIRITDNIPKNVIFIEREHQKRIKRKEYSKNELKKNSKTASIYYYPISRLNQNDQLIFRFPKFFVENSKIFYLGKKGG